MIHSSKYRKLISDIRKHGVIQAEGHCFSINGYLRRGVNLSPNLSQIVFRKVAKGEPSGILFSKDKMCIDIIHDFCDMDNILNEHRLNTDGCGSTAEEEFLSISNIWDQSYNSDDEIQRKEHNRKYMQSEYSNPVFIFSWSVFEQYVIHGTGVFIETWFIPSSTN